VGETCVWRGKVNGGDEGEGIWLVDFIYIYEIEYETSCNCFKWSRERLQWEDGGDHLTNVQHKSIWIWHFAPCAMNIC
jgi:hypothetical protein